MPFAFPVSANRAWGAAVAAFRINGSYIKTQKWPGFDYSAFVGPMRIPNKTLAKSLLSDLENEITSEDIEKGKDVQRYYKTFIFKVISDKPLSDFDKQAMRVSECEEITCEFDFAILISLIGVSIQKRQRDSVEQKIAFASGGFIGSIGNKVTVEVEVIKTVFSQAWNTYYSTAITNANQAVFFSCKKYLAVNEKLKIVGTVKAHKENKTQLNRVKILS